jgi:hypothetical protein
LSNSMALQMQHADLSVQQSYANKCSIQGGACIPCKHPLQPKEQHLADTSPHAQQRP